ncbi:hypothetical protein DPMN_021597 [Dreissena polymorpha]|uniref:Uncharacterized protein n=1 Tax=Dreissena polymorpha TaxID=45954 RepID=A0A9D4NPA1_DREPO|nr:hypothetical protein DPMN_021597 [Dreissena polymorpha]
MGFLSPYGSSSVYSAPLLSHMDCQVSATLPYGQSTVSYSPIWTVKCQLFSHMDCKCQLFSHMGDKVSVQGPLLCKASVTQGALVRFLPRVSPDVDVEVGPLPEHPLTH